jgi:syntaxin-binding protein 1
MELLRGLPEYQDILSKYSLHIELSKQCFDAIEKLKLMEIGKIEQELATGVDDEGKDVSCIKVFQSLTTLVQSGRIGPEEKLRLVALYLSQVNDVNESSAQTLVRTAASLSMEYESIVKQFLTLGIHGTKAASGVQSAAEKGAGASSRHSHKLANDKNQLKRNKARAKASSYVNCRFIPKLKDLVESVLTNVVDNTEYPLIGSSASASSYSVTSGGASDIGDTSPTSFKSTASMWGQTKAAADGQLAEENEGRTGDEGKRRQKIVVFVIGGITLAETRAMAELEQQYNCDVLIGGSCLLTPKRLFEILLAPTPIL